MTSQSAILSKQRRETLKQQGLCTNCGKLPHKIDRVKCAVCLELSRISHKKYRDTNPNFKEVKNHWKNNSVSRQKNREARKRWRIRYRIKVLNMLGGCCECCGETNYKFLQIDHVNKDGYIYRKEVSRGFQLLKDYYRNPTKYKLRVLCANCHYALTHFDECPHKSEIKKDGLAKI